MGLLIPFTGIIGVLGGLGYGLWVISSKGRAAYDAKKAAEKK